jgi:hypothetical protein
MNAGANGSLVCMADSSRSITPLEPVKKLLRIHIEFIGTAAGCGVFYGLVAEKV